jgi:putative hydrolase of the HAD superfamily
MHFDTLFFDLDETLYPSSSGLWLQVRDRINAFLHEKMGFPSDQVQVIREKFFLEYGTTLRGLQANYQVDMEEYLAYVHDIQLQPTLQPDAHMRAVIESLPGRKYILTNADCAHAGRVTRALGLDGLWTGCIDVHDMYPYCKPMPEAFKLALKAAGSPDPRACALLDDQARVTRAARQMGMFTILVGRQSPGEDADAALQDWSSLASVLNSGPSQ